MYQKQILMEKLKEATASVLPISLIVMAISFVLVPVDAGLMLSFVIATAMLILGMGLFTLGADMSMSRIGNYMGSKLTKSRKLPLILTVSFALGVAITVAEPDLQVLAGNVPEIDTTVLILTVSVGVGFFLMLCMVRILFSISLRTMLIVFYAIVFAAAFLSDESILSVAFDSGGVKMPRRTASASSVCARSGRSFRCCCSVRSTKRSPRRAKAAPSPASPPRWSSARTICMPCRSIYGK